jgi:hypothetical protein
MKRDSAVELRDRWVGTERARRSQTNQTGAETAEAASAASVRGRIAVGITGRDGDYRPAIRLQSPTADSLQAVAAMREEAKGELEVRQIGEVLGLALPVRPLVAGVSIGNRFGEPGTLGCVVRKRGTATPLFALSNNHVLARINFAKKKELIEHPAAGEQSGPGPFVVGEFGETVTLVASGNVVDAAIAPLLPSVNCDVDALFGVSDRFAGLRVDEFVELEAVHKVGKTTGKTTGRLKAWGIADLAVKLGNRTFDFDDQIEIVPDAAPFCAAGDSGSVVLDTGNLVLGLLFSKSALTERSYANRIEHVFDQLDVELA